ncbi:MAG: tetratricopeptide repeat protein [Candidatus Margulisiibacteriota bacterium]
MNNKLSSRYFDYAVELTFMVLVSLVPIIFDRRIGIVFSLTKSTTLSILLSIILAIWAIKLLICKEHRFVKLPANWPVLSYMLTCTVAVITSVQVFTSLVGFYGRYEGLVTLYTYGLLFFIASNYIYNLKLLKMVIALVSCSGMIMAIYSILQRYALDPYMWGGVPTKDRVIATIGQPNFWAAYCVMAFLLVLGFLFHEKDEAANAAGSPAGKKVLLAAGKKGAVSWPKADWKTDWLEQISIIFYYLIAQITFLVMIYNIDTNNPLLWYFGFAVITAAALFFAYNFDKLKGVLLNVVLFANAFFLYVSLLYTQSRGGYMGFFVGLFLFFLLAGKEVMFRNWKKLAALFILIVGITGYIVVFTEDSPFARFSGEVKFERMAPSENVDSRHVEENKPSGRSEKKLMISGAAGSRIETWRSALKIIADYPFFGIGPEVLKMVFPRYETWMFRFREAFHVKQDRCHNSICDQNVTRGMVSFAIYVWLLSVVIWGGYQASKKAPIEKKLFLAALIAAAVSYIVQNQFSFGVVAIGSLFWILLGIIARFAYGTEEEIPEKTFVLEDVPWIPVALVVLAVSLAVYLALLPFRGDMYFKAGKTFSEMGRLPQAVENFEKSLSIFPYEGGANTNYGITSLNLAQPNLGARDTFSKVENIFLKATHIDPYNADNLYILGKMYLICAGSQGPAAIEQAVIYSNQALQIDPYYAEAYLTLGYAADMQGKKKVAAENFVRAFEINPNLDEAMNRANAIFSSYAGGRAEGIAEYLKVLAKYPKDELPKERARIARRLADLYLLDGNAGAAEALFDDILVVDPQNVDVQATLASLYIDLGKLDAAFNILKTAVVVDPKNVIVHSALGRYYIKVGRMDSARAEFEQVLQVDPGNAFAREALQKLGR